MSKDAFRLAQGTQAPNRWFKPLLTQPLREQLCLGLHSESHTAMQHNGTHLCLRQPAGRPLTWRRSVGVAGCRTLSPADKNVWGQKGTEGTKGLSAGGPPLVQTEQCTSGDSLRLQVCLASFDWTQLRLISSSAAETPEGEQVIPVE